ncbi:recombination regulator RecX [Pseudomethylobacillus aquaticus]|uniref:Regulatory protein RecX n=1 Tax=Pseudomethylobacillus aquaticus TaxID=2676064 RepID=A0A3N0UYR8_9PROT|nr:recombination regulator RecX [Pseudomethylobacillus aquaticus]ROH85424.1 recombination regulator RecX [Pseudomethylobacillus aquaticus]
MRKSTSKPPRSLRERALGYLARREHSARELQQKLSAFVTEQDDLPALLKDFEQRGWLSDARYTEQLVHARKSRYGSQRVAQELREHGVADTLINEAVASLKQDELAYACAICRKKYAAAPASREEWAKQARFLQSRGFGVEVIRQALKQLALEQNKDAVRDDE